jgi:hypothetical protein
LYYLSVPFSLLTSLGRLTRDFFRLLSVTIAFSLVSAILAIVPVAPVLTLPNVVVVSSMACLVFRQFRIGLMTDPVFIPQTIASFECGRRGSHPRVVIQENELRRFEVSTPEPINTGTTKTAEFLECRDLADGFTMSKGVLGDTTMV